MKQDLCHVIFEPLGVSVEVPFETTVLKAAELGGILIEGPCNGKGTCGKCLVRSAGDVSDPGQQETAMLGQKIDEGWRLACQTRIMGDALISLPGKNRFETILGGQARKYPFEPPLKAGLGTGRNVIGVAVDIGTTSIVATMIDLKSEGRELATAGTLNPQTVFGGDVLTRINFAHERPANVEELQRLAVQGMNGLIETMCQQVNIEYTDICYVTVAANTTMLHMLAGVDPVSLAVAPYEPVFLDFREIRASQLGMKTSPDAVVSLLPSLSAFVGADILAGVVATDFHRNRSSSLFVDIGTNGEIVANVNGRLAATSSAAGPALEGMNIHYGCRAEDGAISEVQINGQGEVLVQSIGSARRKGICGSGLVDLVAELVRHSVILESGRYAEPENLPPRLAKRLIDYQGQKAFVVDPETMIVLTQKDIRQVQLAKGAIAAAIEILVKRLGVNLNDMEKVYVAGAFGFHLKPESLKAIGLLPPGLDGEIIYVGNTAKEGARLCLTSRQALEEIKILQEKITPVELSYAPEFQENFVEQMDFKNPESRQ